MAAWILIYMMSGQIAGQVSMPYTGHIEFASETACRKAENSMLAGANHLHWLIQVDCFETGATPPTNSGK